MRYRYGKRCFGMVLALATLILLWGTNSTVAQAEEIQEQTQEQTQELTRDYVIVLDPGHGGADMGANRVFWNTGFVERDINLILATYCKEELEKNPRVKVYLTRYDNTSPLMNRQQRAQVAQNVHADALVSFHINSTGAMEQYEQSGASVYYPNANYNGMLSNVGFQMANEILNELSAVGVRNNGALIRNATDGSTYPDGSLSDYLGINYWTKLVGIPGILVEHAFVNNPNDCANYFMTNEQLRMLAVADAKGIMNSITNGLLDYKKPGTWYKDSVGWWYGYAEGGYAANTWEFINGKWYFFDGRGYMVTGWVFDNGTWYYMNPSGAMATGWVWDGRNWYYMYGNGAMATGWIWDGRNWYYMYGNGAMATGWVWDGANWYYMNGSGAMVTGWVRDGRNWYYMNGSGAMTTGWIWDGRNWYYMYGNGAMAANTWIGPYYVNASGAWVATR